MKKLLYTALAFVLVFAATPAFAQLDEGGDKETVGGILTWVIKLINDVLVPIVFALAFLLFLFGVFKYFFTSGAKAEENRKEGKQFILWGIIAFAVMISIWGLVNILVQTFDFENESRPCLPTFSGPCDSSDPTE